MAGLILCGAGCSAPRVTVDPVYFPQAPATARVVHLKSFNSLCDIAPAPVRFSDLLRGGAVRPFVKSPAGIAYRNDHLYICDGEANLVHDWDLATGKSRRIGQDGDTPLAKPVAVAVDERGYVYVADTGLAAVIVFDPAGVLSKQITPPDRESYRPVAVAEQGGKLYVADVAAHGIDVFTAVDGAHLGAFGQPGSEPGQLYFPTGVAADRQGRVFVSDMMNARVQVFDAGHKPIISMGRPGDRYGDLGKPKNLAVGPDGTIFIADAEFAHIHLFNEQGQLLMLLGGPTDQPGGTPLPVGVAIAATLPERVASLVPDDFTAGYFLFVTNGLGNHRVSLYAIGTGR